MFHLAKMLIVSVQSSDIFESFKVAWTSLQFVYFPFRFWESSLFTFLVSMVLKRLSFFLSLDSSDSNSDGGSPEEHTACSPSMKNGGTTSVVTINGTSIKQPYTSLEDSLILSSDISSTPAELRASKSNFIRFRGTLQSNL